MDLEEEVKKYEGKPTTAQGRECRELFELAEELPEFEPKLLSIERAAALVGVSPQTLRNWEKQGKVHPQRTESGHRRYDEREILELRKKQMDSTEIILPDIMPGKLLETAQRLLSEFNPEQPIQITISTDHLERKVKITLESDDGLTSVTKTFRMED
jgi:DNA-binding transcriptional MerR regulator